MIDLTRDGKSHLFVGEDQDGEIRVSFSIRQDGIDIAVTASGDAALELLAREAREIKDLWAGVAAARKAAWTKLMNTNPVDGSGS